MKAYLPIATACLALQAVAFPAQAQQGEIEKLLSKYEEALNTGDAPAAARLYTDDGVLLAPENPAAVGSKVLQQAYAGIFQAIALNIRFKVAETQLLSPEWAFLRTTSTGVIKIRANGAEIPEGNQELFLLRKTGGQWKIARYSFSSFLPPSK